MLNGPTGFRLVAAACLATFVATFVGSSGCIRLPTGEDASAPSLGSAARKAAVVVWDGDKHGGGKEWANCNLKSACESTVQVAPATGTKSSVALQWRSKGKDWKGFGWNWFGFYPEDAGTDLTKYQNLVFSIRLKVEDPKRAPDLKDIKVGLASSNKVNVESEGVPLLSYVDSLSDGEWHEVVVPIHDLTKGKGKNFDLTRTWEFRLGEYSLVEHDFTVFLDDIGFDNRAVISMISLPEKRNPTALGSQVVDVTAKVDLGAAGAAVSPYIYGVSHGDAETLHEMGVPMRRMGGNLSSVYDWKTGFVSAGADWFFENRKALETPHPQENWWVVMQRENKKYGMKSFFTLPSEWVAKDGTSSGFPKSMYPDCDDFAPDRPDACNGKLKQKNKEGKQLELRCSAERPTQNGKHVGAEYNVDLLKYCIKDAGFGRADQGGIDVVSIDNEPMLYRQTHRDMWCKGFTADAFWDHTKKYAELIRQADPSVKIAAPALWGWTAYSYSSGDQDYQEEHGLSWDKAELLPDFKKYGPFAKDFMRRCAEYKAKTGRNLIDIFVFHGYPMTPQLDYGNQAAFAHPSPELQEFRVRDVRKFWDVTYRDPETWMGKEKWANGNIAYIPLMRRWMKEAGWDVPLAIGEYDHAGPEGGLEISGAVAQAETLAAFARTQLAYGMYWADPRKNGPLYFAFKMFRNPDGKRTAVGDHFIVGDVSDADSVGVYVFKDATRKVASFIITNKRAKTGAKLALDLGVAVPAQKAARYEYSGANLKAIGELPPLELSGKTLNVSIAPMSILRVDVQL
jgi:hypothetical protein